MDDDGPWTGSWMTAAAGKSVSVAGPHVFGKRLRGSGRDIKLASSYLLQNGSPHDLSSTCLASCRHVLFRQCLGHVFDLYHSMLQINALRGRFHFRCGYKWWMLRPAATSVDRTRCFFAGYILAYSIDLSHLSSLAAVTSMGPGGYDTAVDKSENTPMRALSDPVGLEVR